MLKQCAVFVGGFGLEQATALIDLSDFPDSPEVPEALELLCRQSLMYRVMAPERRGECRYALYGVVRLEAERALQESGAVDRFMDRHAEVYLALVEGLEEQIMGPDGSVAMDRLAIELNNVLAVHRRYEELRPNLGSPRRHQHHAFADAARADFLGR